MKDEEFLELESEDREDLLAFKEAQAQLNNSNANFDLTFKDRLKTNI